MAHGAPRNLDEVEDYVMRIRHGRPLAPELMADIKSRYERVGGSPFLHWTTRQMEALQKRWPRKVYLGCRHSHPFLEETMTQMDQDEIPTFTAICLAPQFSSLTVGAYRKALDMARADRTMMYSMVRSYARHPGLIECFREKLARSLEEHPGAFVIFTAHSLPQRVLQEGDPYDWEVKETARLTASAAQIKDWKFAYQSQGLTSEPWLGPTVIEVIDELATKGVANIIVAPIGFVCDHVEILYDIDIQYREYAASKGIQLYRTESLNDSPGFIDLLVQLAGDQAKA